MSRYETWTVTVAVFGAVVNTIVFLLLAFQLRLLRTQIDDARMVAQDDHERRKQQATIEFYAMTLQESARAEQHLPNDYDTAAVAQLDYADPPTRRAVISYLRLFESLSAGVNTGVFDLRTIDHIAGGRIIAIHHAYSPYIEGQRSVTNQRRMYEELERLAVDLRQTNAEFWERLSSAVQADPSP